ncbi:hypothetical protein OsccyDRAFT_2293 [Leptolyngbyaceae cyanobacterium JSC-12]|nr:hypothetical protein OsccyDRAFT_2293 [Leptolyngbyaceae cyanobacterium JSC-12]
MKLVHALKEWQVAVEALEQGETIALLRKGGIREEQGKFSVHHDRVWLYPTFEHQKPELLKPEYAHAVQPVEMGWHPDKVRIGSWAEITDVFQVWNEAMVMQLLPFHIWNQAFVTERLQWKPNQPLYVLLLRVYKLLEPQMLAYSPTYGGCKSWIDLETAIAIEASDPVLEEAKYCDRVAVIRSILYKGQSLK